jgi:hypothetical protein
MSFIRLFAKHHKQFTVRDLVPPLNHRQAITNAQFLFAKGELKRIRPSFMSGYQKAEPSIYKYV